MPTVFQLFPNPRARPRRGLGFLGLVLGLTLVHEPAAALPAVPLGWSHSVASLKQAARTPPKNPQQALELGLNLRRAGLFAESVTVLRGAYLRRPPAPVSARLRSETARSLLASNAYRPALAECSGLKALDAVAQRVCLAEAQLAWKRASLALEEAEKATRQNPEHYEAQVALARALKISGKPTEAEAAFGRAIKLDAKRWPAHYYLGELLAHERKGRRKVVAAYRAAHAADAEQPEVLVALANSLTPGTEAADLLKLALKIRPDFGEALAGLGVVQLELGQLDLAVVSLAEALKTDAARVDWWVAYGRVRLKQAEPAEALKAAATAQALVKNDSGAKLLEADAKAASGEIDVAIEAYELAYGYAHNDPRPLIHAAQACLTHDRPTTGRAFAERATQEYPKHGPGWEILGDIAVVQKDIAPARTAYKKALKVGGVNKAAVRRKLAQLK